MKEIKKLRVKKITPMFTKIVTTADTYTKEESLTMGIYDPRKENTIKDMQRVLTVGTSCRFVAPGDLVSLNYTRYGRTVQKKDTLKQSMDEHYDARMVYDIPLIELDGQTCLFIDEADVVFKVDEYEEDIIQVNDSGLILPDNGII